MTLVELLVVVGIIVMLAMLLLPAVSSPGGNNRRNQCVNHLKQLTLATLHYHDTQGRFPGYAELLPRGDNAFATVSTPSPDFWLSVQTLRNPPDLDQVDAASWATMLLPYLERSDHWDQLVDPQQDGMYILPIDNFICPADVDAPLTPRAPLSYIANTGAWDRDHRGLFLLGPGLGDTPDNGIFLDRAEFERRSLMPPDVRFRDIKDGASRTILLSENVDKDYSLTSPFSWFHGTEQELGMVWVVKVDPVAGDSLVDQERINSGPDAAIDRTLPRLARPASNHVGGVNVAYCDGRVTFMAEDVDYIVYQQLLTPNGAGCVDPRDHSTVKGPIGKFRSPSSQRAADRL